MTKISVITTTLNAEKHIKRFLQALQWADEVVITDAGSTDNTLNIARQFDNVKIYHLQGCSFSEGFQNSFENAEGEWILMLGVDEIVIPELAREIQRTIENTRYDGFKIPSKVLLFGKWIDEFPSKSKNVRLARKSKARFLPRRKHERMVVEGKIGYLKYPYLHFHDYSVSQFLKKLDRYTTLEVNERLMNNEPFSLLKLIFRPVKYFIWQLIFLQRIKYGVRGFFLSGMKAFYKFVEEMKMFEGKEKEAML